MQATTIGAGLATWWWVKYTAHIPEKRVDLCEGAGIARNDKDSRAQTTPIQFHCALQAHQTHTHHLRSCTARTTYANTINDANELNKMNIIVELKCCYKLIWILHATQHIAQRHIRFYPLWHMVVVGQRRCYYCCCCCCCHHYRFCSATSQTFSYFNNEVISSWQQFRHTWCPTVTINLFLVTWFSKWNILFRWQSAATVKWINVEI